jgi:RimJ/RimL family protein N-acetyltransferase
MELPRRATRLGPRRERGDPVGIGLREDARGKGYGGEALALLTDWLFDHAAAERVQAPTDLANAAMRAVFERIGWRLVGTAIAVICPGLVRLQLLSGSPGATVARGRPFRI